MRMKMIRHFPIESRPVAILVFTELGVSLFHSVTIDSSVLRSGDPAFSAEFCDAHMS
jgi:hypothetical protein